MTQSKMHRIVERLFAELYGLPLSEWVADRRSENMAWRQIEKEVYAKTDGAIDVSHVTLLDWYGDVEREPAA